MDKFPHEECPYMTEGRVLLAEIRKDIKTLCEKIEKLLMLESQVRELGWRVAKLEERWKLVAGIASTVTAMLIGLGSYLFK